jgi:hypothetical protein
VFFDAEPAKIGTQNIGFSTRHFVRLLCTLRATAFREEHGTQPAALSALCHPCPRCVKTSMFLTRKHYKCLATTAKLS